MVPGKKKLFETVSQTETEEDEESEDDDYTDYDIYRNDNIYNELTEDDLEFLLDNTGFKAEQIQKWHSDFMCKCPSGYISFQQFESSYRLLLPLDLNEKSKLYIINKLFSLFDIDSDDRLNFSEFLISFWIRCKAPTREKFTWIFNMFDLDRNGCLSYSELKNALSICLNVEDLDALLDQLNNEYSFAGNHSQSDESNSSFTSISNNNVYSDLVKEKKYDLFSKTTKLIDDKLDQTIFLLDSIGSSEERRAKSTTNMYAQMNRDQFCSSSFTCSSSSSSSCASSSSSICFNSDFEFNSFYRIDSFSNVKSCNFNNKSFDKELKRIQVGREEFLDLCEKYTLFRKLILPIKNFYI
jgi:Ca2+-binding EF-hand superfamily protein